MAGTKKPAKPLPRLGKTPYEAPPFTAWTNFPKPNVFIRGAQAKITKPGQNYKHDVSPSRFNKFLACPRCYWYERFGCEPEPDGPSWLINLRIDHLAKMMFDNLRPLGKALPVMAAAGYPAPPWNPAKGSGDDEFRMLATGAHPSHKDGWRGARLRGVPHGKNDDLNCYGVLDEICIMPNDELLVVDVKGKSKVGGVNILKQYSVFHAVQLDFYAWFLMEHGYKVHEKALLLVYNAESSQVMMDPTSTGKDKLEFNVEIVEHTIDTSYIRSELDRLLAVLIDPNPPPSGRAPDYYGRGDYKCNACTVRDQTPA